MSTCTSQPLIIKASQPAGSNLPFEIDAGSVAVSQWEPNASVAANAVLSPSVGNETGFLYQNGGSVGQSGRAEPAWPVTAGATVIDGSLTLTAVVPPASGEDAISSVTWTQMSPPDGTLMISHQSFSSLVASAFIGGGTSGNVYVIEVAVTMVSTAIYVAQLLLTIL